MTTFVCRVCWPNPRQGCMHENHSTAFPHAMMQDLGCPSGRKPNWRYIDRPTMRKTKPSMPQIGSILKCYSQRDLETGLTPEQFYEKQGRIFKRGDWIFPKEVK